MEEYVLMSDHVHLVVSLCGSTASLPRIVQAFKSLTTAGARARGLSSTKLWQRGYYERVIRGEREFLLIRQYIRNKPLSERLECLGPEKR